MDDTFSETDLAIVVHGFLKNPSRAGAKIEGEYSKLSRPQAIHVKDWLRVYGNNFDI